MAALLEIGDDTFAKIRVSAGFPAPVMIGEGDRCRRWKKADIDNKKPPEGGYLHPKKTKQPLTQSVPNPDYGVG